MNTNLSSTYCWSQPLHSGQVGGAQNPLADGASFRRECLVKELYSLREAVICQLLEVLAKLPVRVCQAPVTVLNVTSLHDVQTHAGGRHRCGFLVLTTGTVEKNTSVR